MSLSTRGKLIAVAAMTAGVVSISYAASRSQKEKRKKAEVPEEESPLEGVFSLGTRLPERVIANVELPIEFSFEPRTVTLQGAIVDGSPNIEDETQLGNLVTDITHERANIAYEYVDHLVGNEGYDLANNEILDEVVQRTVSVIAPRVDWSQGLIYAFNSPEGYVWRGTQLIAEMAYQSHWNTQALA